MQLRMQCSCFDIDLFLVSEEGRTRLCSILIELIIRVATVLATSFKTTPCILTLRTTASAQECPTSKKGRNPYWNSDTQTPD